MQITKFGHSCLLIEHDGSRILTDPGIFSELPDGLKIDALVITHTHADHLDLEKIRLLASANPNLRIITNSEVADILAGLPVRPELVEDGAAAKVGNVSVQGFGKTHEEIHPSIPLIKNIAYFIAGRLWFPGDSLMAPPIAIEILALPVVAPWSKTAQTVDFLEGAKPKTVFPIHDGFLKVGGPFYSLSKMWADKIGAEFIELQSGRPIDLD